MRHPQNHRSSRKQQMLPELLDQIFPLLPYPHPSSLPQDCRYIKTDLLCCSLVCRQWRALARRHIFRNTTFAFDCVEASQWKPPEGFFPPRRPALRAFMEFLETSPDVCVLIRRLNLIKPWRSFMDQTRVPREVVQHALSLLPALQYVMFDGFSMTGTVIQLHDGQSTESSIPATSTLGHIVTLEFRAHPELHVYRRSMLRDIEAAVGLYSDMETLRITSALPTLLTVEAQEVDSSGPRRQASITALDIELEDPWSLALLKHLDLKALKCLRIPIRLKSFSIHGEVLVGPTVHESWLPAFSETGLGGRLEVLFFRLFRTDIGEDTNQSAYFASRSAYSVRGTLMYITRFPHLLLDPQTLPTTPLCWARLPRPSGKVAATFHISLQQR